MFHQFQPSSIVMFLTIFGCFQQTWSQEAKSSTLQIQNGEEKVSSFPELLSGTSLAEAGIRVKRGFGHTGGGGYGGGDYGGAGYGFGGAAAIAQQAANQAKAAQAAQGAAAYQAAQQASATLAQQAAHSAQQAQAVTAAKQAQVAQISQAANAAQSAAYVEAAQSAKAQRALQSAEVVKQNALQSAHHGGYGAEDQLYAAQHAVEQARSVAAWQAQMAHQAQQNAWSLAQKQQAALHDLHQAQEATNKAIWAATAAQANIGGYGHGGGHGGGHG